jgi:hypothetical protein
MPKEQNILNVFESILFALRTGLCCIDEITASGSAVSSQFASLHLETSKLSLRLDDKRWKVLAIMVEIYALFQYNDNGVKS